ncbi:hypothetical protein BGZ75_001091 [Mortierella antarctica]|nr:hypothetical protein BGZ75_001091 [Mortierella antarctica]
MAEQPQQAPSRRTHLFQRRQQQQQQPQQHLSNTPHHYQHQNHTQFISSGPLPNPRPLFPDPSRARRAFHNSNMDPGASYGAINQNSMNINTAGANAAVYQSGYKPPGPGTPKQKQVPLRTTKVSQKLVLLPEDQEEAEDEDDEVVDGPFADHVMDPFREEPEFRPRRRGLHGRAPTHSELLTKEQRNVKGLARVVAYCTAEGYDLKRLSAYLKANHSVHPRLYDEALYAAYHFPLIPGTTSRFMSAPPIRSPGGGSILDKQLERYEDNTDDYSRSLERDSHEEHFRRSASGRNLTDEEYHQHLQDQSDRVSLGGGSVGTKKLKNRRRASSRSSRNPQDEFTDHNMTTLEDPAEGTSSSTALEQPDYFTEVVQDHNMAVNGPDGPVVDSAETLLMPTQTAVAAPFMGGEVFFYDYGVTVFWNMTVEQEAWILDDLAEFEIKRLSPEDAQTEEFHFEYAGYSTPRIYNDMITLRGGNHMIKLTISHAISQSVKLALYECQMDDTIDDTKIIPIQLAQTGKLNYSRPQITRISGHLFQLRMNVDLVSNMLDTPEIFWSEPELRPLYDAIRGYLEIGQRAKVLSDRCLVISDLLTMLRDDLASNNMNYITWIIIILIVIAVIVAGGEIVVKYMSHFGSEGAGAYRARHI